MAIDNVIVKLSAAKVSSIATLPCLLYHPRTGAACSSKTQVSVVRLGHPARLMDGVQKHSLDALLQTSDSADVTRFVLREGRETTGRESGTGHLTDRCCYAAALAWLF
jgi:hypothetical protein